MKKFYIIVFGWLVLAVGNIGCLMQQDYGANYMPLREGFPKKPANAILPILERPPQRPYIVIGKMAYETSQNLNSIYKSIQYNARKHGADAVIMHNITSRRREWVESKPPSMSIQNDLDWVATPDGSRHLQWVDKPIYDPGYINRRMEETLRSVQAEMIVFQ